MASPSPQTVGARRWVADPLTLMVVLAVVVGAVLSAGAPMPVTVLLAAVTAGVALSGST